jgi:hypothetical protein
MMFSCSGKIRLYRFVSYERTKWLTLVCKCGDYLGELEGVIRHVADSGVQLRFAGSLTT